MPKLESEKPKLVNRGTAGLLTQLPQTEERQAAQETQLQREDRILRDSPKDRIATSLLPLAVPIESLTPDPKNARVHNERNLRSIMLSLAQFGQRKPVSVHKNGMIVMAGNGTLEAAKALGWTKLAAAIDDDLSHAEAIGYGLADNRTAELAKWDFETVAILDKIVSEAGLAMAGWSLDELEVLRAADWTPPILQEGGFDANGKSTEEGLLYSFTPDQHAPVYQAIETIRNVLGGDVDKAECLVHICRDWMESKRA